MQWLGTDIMRRLYHDVWAKGTYRKIANESFRIALITDGRFPNEIDSGIEVEAKSLRLLRAVKDDGHKSETALDEYPLHKYSAVLDNRSMTLTEQFEALDPIIDKWFKEVGIEDERSISQPLSSSEAE